MKNNNNSNDGKTSKMQKKEEEWIKIWVKGKIIGSFGV